MNISFILTSFKAECVPDSSGFICGGGLNSFVYNVWLHYLLAPKTLPEKCLETFRGEKVGVSRGVEGCWEEVGALDLNCCGT